MIARARVCVCSRFAHVCAILPECLRAAPLCACACTFTCTRRMMNAALHGTVDDKMDGVVGRQEEEMEGREVTECPGGGWKYATYDVTYAACIDGLRSPCMPRCAGTQWDEVNDNENIYDLPYYLSIICLPRLARWPIYTIITVYAARAHDFCNGPTKLDATIGIYSRIGCYQ